MKMAKTEKNRGRLFFSCSMRRCPFFQWVNEDPRGKNRIWLEADKFTCLFDGRIIKRSFEDVMGETPLQKGVRQSIDKHMGPFEGNWHPQDLSPRTQASLDLLVHKDSTGGKAIPRSILMGRIHPQRNALHGTKGIGSTRSERQQILHGPTESIRSDSQTSGKRS